MSSGNIDDLIAEIKKVSKIADIAYVSLYLAMNLFMLVKLK